MEATKTPQNLQSNHSRQIRFKKPFSEKYTLTVTTDILAGSFPVETKAQVRWALRVIEVDAKGQAEIELITIEHKLLESNNPNFNDIAALSQAFARMYSEIHVKLTPQGKVLKVLNLQNIIDKWEQSKTEMQEIVEEVPAMQDLINLNDEIFADPDKVKLAIENNEFFSLSFNLIYGATLPADSIEKTQRNLFNSVEVNWSFSAHRKQAPTDGDSSVTEVEVVGKPIDNLDAAWIKKAYGAFDFIELKEINPDLAEVANYSFQPESGRLLKLTLIKKEVAHPEYIRGEIKYELKSDKGLKKEVETGYRQNKLIDKKIEKPREFFWEDN